MSDENCLCGGNGEKAFRNALDDANVISSKLDSEKSGQIDYSINSLKNVLNDFCSLTKEGKVSIGEFFFVS